MAGRACSNPGERRVSFDHAGLTPLRHTRRMDESNQAVLTEGCRPPVVLGTAALTHAGFAGAAPDELNAMLVAATTDPVARAYDRALALQLDFRRAQGLDQLDDALAASPLYRVRSDTCSKTPLRVLALMTPGDLMVNTPLDFLTRFLDVRLDLLYVMPGEDLPAVIPDHDLAFVASSAIDTPTLGRMTHLFRSWPRPILNDPRFLPRLERDALSNVLQGVPGVVSPRCLGFCRSDVLAHAEAGRPPGLLTGEGEGAILIRPAGSHAGTGLQKIEDKAALSAYLACSSARSYFVTTFVDYSDNDGLFRKYRVALIDRVPYLCHMALCEHWMVHYLNAGMVDTLSKRSAEARSMERFDTGFAARHAQAFTALHNILDLDFYSIDCAETRDGKLLVFEADTAAIIHLMDPPDLFPYKHPQMFRVFTAFERMLRRRVAAYVPAPVSDFAI